MEKMRDCKTCVHQTADGCSAWDCEYINRDEAIEAYEILKAMGTNPIRPTAKWIKVDGAFHCSNCDHIPINRIKVQGAVVYDVKIKDVMKYCPICGAKMED